MIRSINIILTITSVLALIAVYALKYTVEETAGQKAAIERSIERQQSDLSLLQADWAYLNQPAHIAPIIERHQDILQLQVTHQKQFGDFASLPMRPAPEPPDAEALDVLLQSLDAGVDPAETSIPNPSPMRADIPVPLPASSRPMRGQ